MFYLHTASFHSLNMGQARYEPCKCWAKKIANAYAVTELSYTCCICAELMFGQKRHSPHMQRMSKHILVAYVPNTMLLNKDTYCGV